MGRPLSFVEECLTSGSGNSFVRRILHMKHVKGNATKTSCVKKGMLNGAFEVLGFMVRYSLATMCRCCCFFRTVGKPLQLDGPRRFFTDGGALGTSLLLCPTEK